MIHSMAEERLAPIYEFLGLAAPYLFFGACMLFCLACLLKSIDIVSGWKTKKGCTCAPIWFSWDKYKVFYDVRFSTEALVKAKEKKQHLENQEKAREIMESVCAPADDSGIGE